MDAFYASIEQRDNPVYRGKPLAVGYSEARGVVAAASYEARKYGIHSAMPSVTAKRKCADLIFVLPRFRVYAEVSQQIRDIFFEYTDLVEPLSLDEAYLAVTENKKNIASAMRIAKDIQQRIFQDTGLTASAGISYNKFLAKIASDYKKPNGFFTILPQDAEKFIEELQIEKFHGIGKKTAERMHLMGIFTGADLKKIPEENMIKWFGKVGGYYYHIVRGVDNRAVEPNRITKSVSSETTFLEDKSDKTELSEILDHLAKEVLRRMGKDEFFGRTVTLKIKFSDFKIITRSRTLPEPVKDFQILFETAKELLFQTDLANQSVRLLGLGTSNAEDLIPPRYIQMKIPFEGMKLRTDFLYR